MIKDALKPGTWHYGSVRLSDHLDSCAFGPVFGPARFAIKDTYNPEKPLEFRFQMWRNAFIRVRMLQ